MNNGDELANGVDPTNPDTDGDGIPDGDDPNPQDPDVTPQTGSALVRVYNAYGVYTNSGAQVYVRADARSVVTNLPVNIVGAEYFHTVAGSNGTGVAMSALDGSFGTTNETVTATFTPSFPAGQRHVIWLHAQGSDGEWCPFVKVIVNPNVEDILNRIQENYAAIQDLQYHLTVTEKMNGETISAMTAIEYAKGTDRVRTELSDGHVSVHNAGQHWWHSAGQAEGGLSRDALEGEDVIEGNRLGDFFWDVPLAKQRSVGVFEQSSTNSFYQCVLQPKAGINWLTQRFQTDFTRGLVTRLEVGEEGERVIVEYLNPVEVLPGKWLFTLHRTTIQFGDGSQLQTESSFTQLQANQGLADDLFAIPEEP
jgi:hypothetical protein